jgi:hypothetical protein|tara:strand:+ start:194 stop:1027 length:834 start_codon:yes stop_codon:yes gene_type:complete
VKVLLTFLFLLSLAITSCERSVEDNVLAQVNDELLYFDDVIRDMPISILDTSAFVEKYISKWIRNKVLLDQALINLDDNSEDIKHKIALYKNSLLIYEYQQRLINQNFDTSVILNDILSYYNENIREFKLNQDIFKGRFIIIDKNAPNIEQLLKIFKSNDNDDIDDLVSYCMLYALEYYVNDSSWNYFNSIKYKIPDNINANNIFLSKRKYDLIEDDKYLYLLFLKDFKIKGSTSPFSLERDKIKSLIINNNKIKYLDIVEKDLVNNGLSINKIKIY